MASTRPFQKVGSAPVRRSLFDLSYRKIFTCDSGQLVPIMCDEVVPGDKFIIGNEIVVRANPLVAPILHEINVYVHYFFVPYRILWPDWEEFITGGEEGPGGSSDNIKIPKFNGLHRGLEPFVKYSLLDYLGFPIYYIGQSPGDYSTLPGGGVNMFPWAAYHFIWDEYYRDENLQDSILDDIGKIFASHPPVGTQYWNKKSYMITGINSSDLYDAAVAFGDSNFGYRFNDVLHRRNWEKDYFTSALPWQQRGVTPSVPLTGQASVKFDFGSIGDTDAITSYFYGPGESLTNQALVSGTSFSPGSNGVAVLMLDKTKFANYLTSGNTIDVSNVGTFDVADLRHIVQIQKWMERNARAGVRYTEFLRSHFRICPRDERLDRPEYIGGTKNGLLFSEVLQTSSTDSTSPQGNLAGHGITCGNGYVGKYVAKEFGLIMGLLSIMPRANYNSQGVNRQWLRNTRYDFYFPEFSHLSEQEVYNCELFMRGDSTKDRGLFGFQGAYDEYRCKQDMTAGDMRNLYAYWHQSRWFGSPDSGSGLQPDDMEDPALNGGFIECWATKRNFAAPTSHSWIVHFGNKIRAVRPMPYVPEPGLLDHF